MPSDIKKKILVGEDEHPMAQALTLKLSHAGFEVTNVANGEDVLRSLEAGHFDLVLLDLVMPKLDGFGVLARLKEKKDPTPVIVLSNLGQEEDAEKAKKLGARAYYIKSDTPIVNIVEHVKEFLSP
ncbi:MAG TPA: response regulator [Candidatus Paceibacterota bacterium]|nr:response regulator [Candidatus Paceibacterota bacterium]